MTFSLHKTVFDELGQVTLVWEETLPGQCRRPQLSFFRLPLPVPLPVPVQPLPLAPSIKRHHHPSPTSGTGFE
jgi:hypothetical protein